jgi:transcriptional regulator with XRE-family HTH domain
VNNARYPKHRRRLGQAIRARREAEELSQEKLAELAGCHRNYVGFVERGEKNCSIDMILRFCKALGTDLRTIAEDAKL